MICFMYFIFRKVQYVVFYKIWASSPLYLTMSGWPSGLRRQTQGTNPSSIREFWSSNEGVGSNPTSDKIFLSSFPIVIWENGETIKKFFFKLQQKMIKFVESSKNVEIFSFVQSGTLVEMGLWLGGPFLLYHRHDL